MLPPLFIPKYLILTRQYMDLVWETLTHYSTLPEKTEDKKQKITEVFILFLIISI